MGQLMKTFAAAAFGLAALGAGAAYADGRDDDDRRDRGRDRDRDSEVSLSISVGSPGYYEDGYRDARYHDRRDDRRYDNRRGGSRVVKRETFDTRWRARIQLVEEVQYRGRRTDYVCTVSVRGPDARYVPYQRVRQIANRHCSPRARVQIYA